MGRKKSLNVIPASERFAKKAENKNKREIKKMAKEFSWSDAKSIIDSHRDAGSKIAQGLGVVGSTSAKFKNEEFIRDVERVSNLTSASLRQVMAVENDINARSGEVDPNDIAEFYSIMHKLQNEVGSVMMDATTEYADLQDRFGVFLETVKESQDV